MRAGSLPHEGFINDLVIPLALVARAGYVGLDLPLELEIGHKGRQRFEISLYLLPEWVRGRKDFNSMSRAILCYKDCALVSNFWKSFAHWKITLIRLEAKAADNAFCKASGSMGRVGLIGLFETESFTCGLSV